jgi:hypothetical protein
VNERELDLHDLYFASLIETAKRNGPPSAEIIEFGRGFGFALRKQGQMSSNKGTPNG